MLSFEQALPDLHLPAAIQLRGETDLALDAIDLQQPFDGEVEAERVVLARQGNDPHLFQARLVLFDEAFDRHACLLQRVVQRQAHVVEIGQPVVGQRLHAARPGAEHLGQMGSHRGHHAHLVVEAGAADGVTAEALEQAAVSGHLRFCPRTKHGGGAGRFRAVQGRPDAVGCLPTSSA